MQNILLGLGVLLLAIAALIFTVVTWGKVEVVGRAAILLVITGATAAAAPPFRRRGLDATAEAIAALAMALLVIDTQGARQSIPSLQRLDAPVFWAGATAVLAALCAAYASLVKLEAPRLVAVVTVQLPGVFLAGQMEPAGASLVLSGQCAVNAYAASRWRRQRILACFAGAAALAGTVAVILAVGAAYRPEVSDFETSLPGAAALVAVGATAGWIGWLLRRLAGAPMIATAVAAVSATAAVFAVSRQTMAGPTLPAVVAVCALVCIAVGVRLGRTWGDGPTAVGSALMLFALAAEVVHLTAAAVGPLGWINESWPGRGVGTSARTLLSPELAWDGSRPVLITVASAAAAAALLAMSFRQRVLWQAAFAPALAATIVVTPLALSWPYAAAIGWELACIAVAALTAIRVTAAHPRVSKAIAVGSAALLVAHAIPWSLAAQQTTHAALVVAVVLSAVAAATRPAFRTVATTIGSAALLGWIFAIPRSAGASLHVCAFVLALAAAAMLAATALDSHRRWMTAVDARVVEVIAAGAYLFIVSLTFYQPAWAGLSLLAGAVAAAAVATRQDRHFAAAVAPAIAAGSIWAGTIALGGTPAVAGLAVALAACATAGLAWLLRDRSGELIEGVAVAAYLIGVGVAFDDINVLPFALAAGGLTLFAVSARRDRVAAAAVGSALLAGTAWAAVIALEASAAAAGLAVALVACALVGVGWLLRHRSGELIELVAATAYAIGLAATLEDIPLLPFALAAGCATAYAVAARPDRQLAVMPGSALGAAAAWTTAIALGTSVAGAGLTTALVGCALAGLGWLLRKRCGDYVEIVAAVAYVVGLTATVDDTKLLPYALAAGCLTLFAISLRPDRVLAQVPASALAAATGWATAIAVGTSVAGAGLTTALVGCALAGLGWLLRHRSGEFVELVAVAAYIVGLGATLDDTTLLPFALAAGCATFCAVAVRPDRVLAVVPGSALAAATAWTAAIALGTSTAGAGLTTALVGCALAGVGWLLRHRSGEFIEIVAAVAYIGGLTATVDDTMLLPYALAAGCATAFAVSVRRDREIAAVLGSALAAATAWTTAIALDTSVAAAGLAAALVGCALAGLGWLLRHRSGELIEAVAVASYLIGSSVTLEDRPLLSFALAAGGVACFAVSIRSDRRPVAYGGWTLLTLLLWLRLAEADVTAPEPYLLPPAALTLFIGYFRRLNNPALSSWFAYGTGLSLGLLPTLYMSLSDTHLVRPLLLGGAALVVVLVGARARLQAPLALGGLTLLIDAGVQVAPLAGSMPRWVSIATVGMILLFVGATYEQRLRDVKKLQDQIDTLA